MKTYFKIFIIIFLLSLFIIIKDDVFLLVNKSFLNIDKNNTTNISGDIVYPDQVKPLKLSVDTPGPLKVAGDLLNVNSNIELSSKNIISITNKFRKENGSLNPLIENDKLNQSATKKLQDMFNNQYFEHKSPKGLGVGDLGEQAGYNYILIGENLAMGNFKDDLSLVNAWMASEGHRENILNKNYTNIGVAVGQGQFNGKKIWMAVQHFGTPESVCPSIDKILLGKININQNQIIEMTQDLSNRREQIDKNDTFKGSTINEQIAEYNELVILYNDLISQTKNDTEIYNDQVKNFNLCLLGYQ